MKRRKKYHGTIILWYRRTLVDRQGMVKHCGSCWINMLCNMFKVFIKGTHIQNGYDIRYSWYVCSNYWLLGK